MIYLTGVTQRRHRETLIDAGIGLLIQPGSYHPSELAHWPVWAADNGCFAQGDAFNVQAWLGWLLTLPTNGCLFATAPDVLGNAEATWSRSEPYFATIRSYGFPACLVAQDGFLAHKVDWTAFDVLFLGGSTEWKLSTDAMYAAFAGITHGKPVHMGRVNSLRRLLWAHHIGCYSADGTFLKYGPDVNLPRLKWQLDYLKRNPTLTYG